MSSESILIVEDEQLIAGYMASGLKIQGHNIVQTVSTGEDAVRYAKRCKPDLVIMDIHLEGKMDGIEAARQIHSDMNIPILFITGCADDAQLEQSKTVKPIGFVAKPFSIKELECAIVIGLNNYHPAKQHNRETFQTAEQHYQIPFKNSEQGLFRIDRSGKFINVNANFAKLTGYDSPKEFLESTPDAHLYFVHPECHRELLDSLKHLEFVGDCKFQARRKDGAEIWLSQTLYYDYGASEPCYIGTALDITRQKEVEENLKSSNARQSALLEAIPEIVTEVDNNKVYKWANGAGFEFFGDDMIGKSASDYFEGEQNVYNIVDPIFKGDDDPIYVESWQRRKDGQKRLLAWKCHGLKNGEGRVIGAISTARDITDSRLAEEAFRRSEEKFQQIAEHIDEVFWSFELDGKKTTYLSSAFENIWGFSPKLVYQSNEYFTNAIHPDDRARVIATLALEERKIPFEMEYRIVRPDGSIRHIWDRGFPVFDKNGHVKSYVGIAQNITAWKASEKKLKESEKYLSQIINHIGDPLFVIDRQHKYVLVNDAMCAFTRHSREWLLGKTIQQLRLKKEEADFIWNEEDTVLSTGQDSVVEEDTTVPGRGTATVITKKCRLIDSEGNHQVVGIIRDITDRKNAERERAEMETQLLHVQKLEAIGQLAAGIAHEINTPIQYVSDNTRFLQEAFTAMQSCLKSLDLLLEANREGKLNPALFRDVEAAVSNADLEYYVDETPKAITQSLEGLDRVATIVRAMKEFSHPSGTEKQNVDINHAITNTATICRNEWKYVADVSLDLDPALPLAPCLLGEFNQVVLNLMVNAAHAIKETIHGNEKQKGRISISTRLDKDWVEIRIGDSGIGIPKKHRSKIFTPFFTTKDPGKGTGQGLAISHSVIVNKHGGTIHFETEEGKGTVFIIRLPLHSDPIQ
jgi:PAS domain S-box-containing protein